MDGLDFCIFAGLDKKGPLDHRGRMEMNGRAMPPSIPEDGEAPDRVLHREMNGFHRRPQAADGGEAELPVCRSQRRKSDVKVYKEFCDFYARL